jgi:hypothetical protein
VQYLSLAALVEEPFIAQELVRVKQEKKVIVRKLMVIYS